MEPRTVTIQQCLRCGVFIVGSSADKEVCEVYLCYMNRPMTKQMGCCWIVTLSLEFQSFLASISLDAGSCKNVTGYPSHYAAFLRGGERSAHCLLFCGPNFPDFWFQRPRMSKSRKILESLNLTRPAVIGCPARQGASAASAGSCSSPRKARSCGKA